MSKYHTKQVVEARRFTDEASAEDVAAWCNDAITYTGTSHGHTTPPWQMHTCVTVLGPRAGGKGFADVGDWIVKHANGEHEVLSDEEFTAEYEASSDE